MQRGILSGIFNDLGSGGNVDITIITNAGVDIRRNVLTPNERLFRNPRGYVFPRGTTAVLATATTTSAAPAAAVAPTTPARKNNNNDDDDKMKD